MLWRFVCCYHGLDTSLLLIKLHHKYWGFVNILHCPTNIFILLLNLKSFVGKGIEII
jgi:hypothetical protein